MNHLTQEINDQPAIREPPGGSPEVGLPIGRLERLGNSGDEAAGVGIGITKVENCRVIEVNGINKRK